MIVYVSCFLCGPFCLFILLYTNPPLTHNHHRHKHDTYTYLHLPSPSCIQSNPIQSNLIQQDKPVADNQATAAKGAVAKSKVRSYRQYMNRKGAWVWICVLINICI